MISNAKNSLVFMPLLVVLFACSGPRSTLNEIVPQDSKVVQLSEGMDFAFLEGPCWDGENTLYFSDIPNNRIYRYTLEGAFSVFRENSNGANGLMFDRAGRLVACEGKAGRVVALDEFGRVVEVLAAEYRGKPFNSPNDLVIDSRGGIYFTDPRFGDESDMPQDKQAVYYRQPDGRIIRLIDDMIKPNGIILSPDEKLLYVVDTYDKFIRAYRVLQDGFLVDQRIFAELKLKEGAPDNRSGADGLAMDVNGDLFVTTSLGVQIYDANGNFVGIIRVPETPANCTFGGADMKTLFITARKNLYMIKLKVPGVLFPIEKNETEKTDSGLTNEKVIDLRSALSVRISTPSCRRFAHGSRHFWHFNV